MVRGFFMSAFHDGRREADRRRLDNRPSRFWYRTARWQRIAKGQIESEPLCRMCQAQGMIEPARICDHIHPHHDDPVRFWGGPFQSLCKVHHDSVKQAEESRGHVIGSGLDGRPLAPDHPWNR